MSTSKSGEASYAWDFENRLTSVPLLVGTTVTHQYDADGNRIQTKVTPVGGSEATTNMLVDIAGCPSCGSGLSQDVVDADAVGNITAVYVRAGDELLEALRSGSTPGTWTTRYVHHDGLGSVRALTDETGTTTDTRGYEAFGTWRTSRRETTRYRTVSPGSRSRRTRGCPTIGRDGWMRGWGDSMGWTAPMETL